MSACRSCGATIWWATTTEGRAMPLDPPDGEGNLRAWRDTRGTLIVRADVKAPHPGGPTVPEFAVPARSHFATCPDADKHRRASRGGA